VTAPANAPSPSRAGAAGARAAWLVGAGIFLSKVSGFVRESVFAFFFGTSPVADVWRAAFRTPNVIQNLLGEGTLSASFIPVYAELLEEGREEEAGHFAGAALGLLCVTAFGATLVGILVAPWMIPLFFPEWAPWQHELGIRIVRVIFVMTAILAVSAWALGILNSHRRFFVAYVAPAVWNVLVVATMGIFGGLLVWGPERLAIALAWGALGGGVSQLLVQLPWTIPVLKSFRLSVSLRVTGVREALRNFWPVVVARGVVNLSGWLDVILAGLVAAGAISILGYAQILYMLPISLFGMSIAASELPELSRMRGRIGDELVPRVRTALERTWFLLVPSAIAYLVLGDLFVAALFEHGEFTRASTTVTWAVLSAYALGLLASSSSRVLSSAYYAVRDTRTPARIAYVRVSVSLIVGVSAMFPLDAFVVGSGEGVLHFGAVGLGLGAAIGSWVEYVLLRRSLGRVIGPHGPPPSRLVRIVVSGLAAMLAAAGAKALLGSAVPLREGVLHRLLGSTSPWVNPTLALGTALAFGVVYLAVAAALGVGASPRRLLRR
jgi:putative peptidoglycan lipid II flippase